MMMAVSCPIRMGEAVCHQGDGTVDDVAQGARTPRHDAPARHRDP